MKTLTLTAVLVLFSTVAFAGVVPLPGKFCGSDVIVDANGIWSEDDAPFDKIVQRGPNWWTVSYKSEDNAGVTSRITLSPNKKAITVVDSDSTHPIVLHRCR